MHPEILDVIHRALEEDIGTGDVTSQACVPADRRASGTFLARRRWCCPASTSCPVIYEARGGVEDSLCFITMATVSKKGPASPRCADRARTLLECERVALNFLQRLSGVATLAHEFASVVKGTTCKVLDTRKTTPGLRRLEKAAAACGGVTNHRMGLFDAILIKNNHIAAAGGVRQAIENARACRPPDRDRSAHAR